MFYNPENSSTIYKCLPLLIYNENNGQIYNLHLGLSPLLIKVSKSVFKKLLVYGSVDFGPSGVRLREEVVDTKLGIIFFLSSSMHVSLSNLQLLCGNGVRALWKSVDPLYERTVLVFVIYFSRTNF